MTAVNWNSYKFPYSAQAEIRMTLEEMGLSTADTGHGGLTSYKEKLHGVGPVPVAMVKIISYGNCLLMIRDTHAPRFLERCDIVEPCRF